MWYYLLHNNFFILNKLRKIEKKDEQLVVGPPQIGSPNCPETPHIFHTPNPGVGLAYRHLYTKSNGRG